MYPNISWNYRGLSMNPNIGIDDIDKYSDNIYKYLKLEYPKHYKKLSYIKKWSGKFRNILNLVIIDDITIIIIDYLL